MDNAFRAQVISNLNDFLHGTSLTKLLGQHSTPVLLLDSQRVKAQYQALQKALPMVDHHFAIKALRHPAVIEAVNECGGFFDVMTNSDVDLVQAAHIAPERCLHTNPIKKPADIAYAVKAGLTTFVVDNEAEIDKFIPHKAKVQLLMRLSFRNPQAKSDLSYKFGVAPDEAEGLVQYARQAGLRVAGLSLHVGSQIDRAEAYVEAIQKAIELLDRFEKVHGYKLDIFDIGGGFPVSYTKLAPSLDEIAAAITPLLAPLQGKYRLCSEPGRFVVAPAMILACQVVGKSLRAGRQWYYLDDGLYGSYSNVMFEDVTPPFIAFKELRGDAVLVPQPCVLAGPTCDSVDVITTDCLLPELEIGDIILSPMMGAYTWVSATEYNGIPRTPVITLR